MSIIEQAARRLEELRRAGIEIPPIPGEVSPLLQPAAAQPVVEVTPSAVAVTQEPIAPTAAPAARTSFRPVLPATPRVDTGEDPAAGDGARSKFASIDLRRLKDEGYLTPDAPRTELAEELRAIKRPIIDHALDARHAGRERGNLILVTSALPGEGKTFCSINLAMSIAMEVDHSVLLVDADVVHPSVMTRLGVTAELGMLDVLTKDSLDLADVLIRTNVPKLSLLPAGSATAKSSELLASGAMEALLIDLAERYPDRIVIFDAPPLLLTSESRVLAARVGQVLMVVQAQKTAQSTVKHALAELEACNTVWCMLNKAAKGRGSGGYGRYPNLPRGD